MADPQLTLAHWVPGTEAEGPGRRFALWLQGCPLRCPGCCNPEFLSFRGGTVRGVAEIVGEIESTPGLEGISLLGGEPTAQAEACAALAREVQRRGLSVMLYSGYTLIELRARNDAAIDDLLAHCDILVDGPYRREQPEAKRRWVGSANQVVHFLSDRYREDDPCWTKRNTLEIRVNRESVSVNGFPATAAREAWRGWNRL
jgi:anaerobic ribonucleoside-triphosphate reductase activating protein